MAPLLPLHFPRPRKPHRPTGTEPRPCLPCPHSLQDADVLLHRGRVGRLPVLLEPDHQNVGLHSPETCGLPRRWGLRDQVSHPVGALFCDWGGALCQPQLLSPTCSKGPGNTCPSSGSCLSGHTHEEGEATAIVTPCGLSKPGPMTGLSH